VYGRLAPPEAVGEGLEILDDANMLPFGHEVPICEIRLVVVRCIDAEELLPASLVPCTETWLADLVPGRNDSRKGLLELVEVLVEEL
jgi:hypothetical protein